MFLTKEIFSTVIENTPLVSIDLIVADENDRVLLGHRTNQPAKGYWFVPGGRIYKNETISEAFSRISTQELGTQLDIEQAQLLGPFTHLYDDFVFGNEFGTHYVAIAYKVRVERGKLNLPLEEQHSEYLWWDSQHLLNSKQVHIHTKWYFQD